MIFLLLAVLMGSQDNACEKNGSPNKNHQKTTLKVEQDFDDPFILPGFDEIKQAYKRLNQQAMELELKAKTNEERTEAQVQGIELLHRKGKPLAEKALTLAKPKAREIRAIPVLVWILETFPFAPQAEEAADLMIKYHPQSIDLFFSATRLMGAAPEWCVKVMRTVAQKAESADRQAEAKYDLAEMYRALAEGPNLIQYLDDKTLKLLERTQGKPYVDRLRNVDSRSMNTQAEKLLEEIIAKYANVKLYGKSLDALAKGDLFEVRNLSTGKTAPEIAGEDIDGKPMKLTDFRGKVVVLEFWGFWQGPYVALIPQRRSLLKKLAGKPFAILGINSDNNRDELKKKIKDENITWRSWWNGGSVDGPIAHVWNVHSWPTIYVLDHNGVIRAKHVRDSSIERVVERLLEELENQTKKTKP